MRVASDLTDVGAVTRRALLIAGAQTLFLGLLGGRLYQLQILEADRYRQLADDNRMSLQLLAPPRGRILDRHGMPLAENRQVFQAVMIADRANRQEDMARLNLLAPLLALDASALAEAQARLKAARAGAPVLITENLDWAQLSKLELRKPDFPNVMIETGQTRSYSFGPAFAHLLGYVGIANERDLEADISARALLRLPGFRIGKGGMEQKQDLKLRGQPGALKREVNAHGQVVRDVERTPPVAGHDMQLTLDAGLQLMTFNRLAQTESAAAVVMDALNGAVYALASTPSFEPNDFALGVPTNIWRGLQEDERVPLLNKALAGQYAPGSTIKMCVAMAGLEAGLVNEKSVFSCPGHLDLGGHRFHCWKRGGHGSVNLHKAIQQSCDVYFYELARRIKIDTMAAMLRRFGLGEPQGLDIPGERKGLVPTPEWKRRARNEPWQQGETLITSIGQGAMLATPLQLAVMTARLVNGGRAVRPHILPLPQNEIFPKIGVREDYLKAIKAAMDAVVMAPGGTAYASRIEEAGFSFGGKTGTSQVRRISKQERARGIVPNELRPWRERDHALFVGYGPVEAPRYVVAVLAEHGGGGGKIAAPMARDIMLDCLKRNPGQ